MGSPGTGDARATPRSCTVPSLQSTGSSGRGNARGRFFAEPKSPLTPLLWALQVQLCYNTKQSFSHFCFAKRKAKEGHKWMKSRTLFCLGAIKDRPGLDSWHQPVFVVWNPFPFVSNKIPEPGVNFTGKMHWPPKRLKHRFSQQAKRFLGCCKKTAKKPALPTALLTIHSLAEAGSTTPTRQSPV